MTVVMINLKVLFFATFREYTGVRQVELELPAGAQVQDLRAQLGQRYPALAPHMASALISVDHEFAFDEDLLADTAEVAVFPRVSGGVASLSARTLCHHRPGFGPGPATGPDHPAGHRRSLYLYRHCARADQPG